MPWWMAVVTFAGGSIYGVVLVFIVDAIGKELKREQRRMDRDD